MRKELVVAGAVAGVAFVAATTAMVMVVSDRKQKSEQRRKIIYRSLRKFARDCATPVPKLWSIADDLATSLVHDVTLSHTSSSADSSLSSSDTPLTLVVSHVAPLPTGEEKGWFYGVNLRGRSVLILSAQLRGNREPLSHLNREEVSIPSFIMTGTSQDLFNYIASKLQEFMSRHEGYSKDSHEHDGKRVLGFTFTYPPDRSQDTLSDSAFKGRDFAFDDKEAKQVIEEINSALDKHGLKMRIFSLVDDTVGDLASGRYYSDNAIVAINLGSGTNIAYAEHTKSLSSSSTQSDELVVNADWGEFKSPHLPLTEYDVSLDIESSNPGCRTFEKLVSGIYLGEIVRKILLKMAQESSLFGTKVPPKLSCPNLLRPMDVAAMHQDTSEEREIIEEKLREIFDISMSTPMARELVGEVCDIAAERGARLVGAGIVGIMKKLNRIKEKKSVVIVQGSLYEHYRVFRNYLHSSVWEMLGNKLSDNVIIQPCHGGSGAGSLFLAATHEIHMHDK